MFRVKLARKQFAHTEPIDGRQWYGHSLRAVMHQATGQGIASYTDAPWINLLGIGAPTAIPVRLDIVMGQSADIEQQ